MECVSFDHTHNIFHKCDICQISDENLQNSIRFFLANRQKFRNDEIERFGIVHGSRIFREALTQADVLDFFAKEVVFREK